jgi:hypothetical protein
MDQMNQNPETIAIAGITLHLDDDADADAPTYHVNNDPHGDDPSFVWRYRTSRTLSQLEADVRDRMVTARAALGTPASDEVTLRRIFDAMNGKTWDADTLDEIADALEAAGFTIAGPDEVAS